MRLEVRVVVVGVVRGVDAKMNMCAELFLMSPRPRPHPPHPLKYSATLASTTSSPGATTAAFVGAFFARVARAGVRLFPWANVCSLPLRSSREARTSSTAARPSACAGRVAQSCGLNR